MPVIKKDNEEGPKSSSTDGGKKGKRKSKPTSKARAKRQKTKDRYAHAREDAQLEGLIPTLPEEALKPERVDPASQGDVPQPKLIGLAIRSGWQVPEERKPDLVDELIKIIDTPEISDKVKVAAFNALRQADQAQYERDHPEEVAKSKTAKSSTVNVNVIQSNVEAASLIREMISRGELGVIEEMQPLDKPGTFSSSGFAGQVEASATSTGDQ